MQNLAELTRRLIAAQVEFVLVGGFAALLSKSIPAADVIDPSLAVYGAYLAAVKRMII